MHLTSRLTLHRFVYVGGPKLRSWWDGDQIDIEFVNYAYQGKKKEKKRIVHVVVLTVLLFQSFYHIIALFFRFNFLYFFSIIVVTILNAFQIWFPSISSSYYRYFVIILVAWAIVVSVLQWVIVMLSRFCALYFGLCIVFLIRCFTHSF